MKVNRWLKILSTSKVSLGPLRPSFIHLPPKIFSSHLHIIQCTNFSPLNSILLSFALMTFSVFMDRSNNPSYYDSTPSPTQSAGVQIPPYFLLPQNIITILYDFQFRQTVWSYRLNLSFIDKECSMFLLKYYI